MIPGLNSELRRKGRTVHIQTEARTTPLTIVTEVFVRGSVVFTANADTRWFNPRRNAADAESDPSTDACVYSAWRRRRAITYAGAIEFGWHSVGSCSSRSGRI